MRTWPDKTIRLVAPHSEWWKMKQAAARAGDVTLAGYIRHLIARDIAELEKQLWARGEKLKPEPAPPLTEEELVEDQRQRIAGIMQRGV